ncbi:MAG: nucleotidyltransferase domain-containing protein [Desulfobacterales bacterium]|nr:nucleotidyltransferase domain-containing protein [Desulfobacterales bacterium]
MQIDDIKKYLDKKTFDILLEANKHSEELTGKSREIINRQLTSFKIPLDEICVVAVGSIGRGEALYASDLDIIPVLKNPEYLTAYKKIDKELRRNLSNEIELKVSKGSNLTKAINISSLSDPETIGGDKDNNSDLTRRILILTEGVQIGGEFELDQIKSNILGTYAGSERTRGRHVLSLCNDIARYYRTLCIDYKCKVDVEEKSWAPRNLKLRHSRKLWYFSCMLSLTTIARNNPKGTEGDYEKEIIKAFKYKPILRLMTTIDNNKKHYFAALLKYYARFLDFMSDQKRREKIKAVTFEDKNDYMLPYLQMKLNSDLLHAEIMKIVDRIDRYRRQKIYDWFLL